jgi:GT2 family glycosyltransferase
MSDSTVPGLTSIIVPCWNQVGFTQQCLAALMGRTRPPWELIIIDNGSTDGTAAYLAGIHDRAAVPVTVISNSSNLGFPAAINQGLQVARGEYLVLLNNDVVVTDDWLEQLTALACTKLKHVAPLKPGDTSAAPDGVSTSDLAELARRPNFKVIDLDQGFAAEPAMDLVANRSEAAPSAPSFEGERTDLSGCAGIGLVGPMSNYAAPPQWVEGVPYRDMSEMPGFARRWRDEHRGQWFTVPKLSGFCLLMKRVVYSRIGGLDERFGLGFFDDDDLAERARRAGFELAVAHDLFVHHFGSRTFAGNGIDAGRLLDENAHRFAAKWGQSGTAGRQVALTPFVDARSRVPEPLDDVATSPKRQRVSAGSNPGMGAAHRASVLPIHTISSVADHARVSLTMIVKDEYSNAYCSPC